MALAAWAMIKVPPTGAGVPAEADPVDNNAPTRAVTATTGTTTRTARPARMLLTALSLSGQVRQLNRNVPTWLNHPHRRLNKQHRYIRTYLARVIRCISSR